MIYMGIESGDEAILKEIHKGVGVKELIEASKKVKDSNILLSVTAIAGIGGREKTIKHSIQAGNLISKIELDYLGILSLIIEDGTELYNKVKNHEFTILSDIEILQELKLLIENINVHRTVVFRCNHASNYITLKGNLPYDKIRLINEIDYYINKKLVRREEDRML